MRLPSALAHIWGSKLGGFAFMFIAKKGHGQGELFFLPLEKHLLKSEIEHIMKEGGVYFAYPCYRYLDEQELRAEGYIFNSSCKEIGKVIGLLPLALRSIYGGVKGIKVDDERFGYFYPLDEIIKLF